MRITTINLSEPQIRALAMLQDLGLYPSRSEGIRVAIRDFLLKELGFERKMEAMELECISLFLKEKHEIGTVEDKKREITAILQKIRKDEENALAALAPATGRNGKR